MAETQTTQTQPTVDDAAKAAQLAAAQADTARRAEYEARHGSPNGSAGTNARGALRSGMLDVLSK